MAHTQRFRSLLRAVHEDWGLFLVAFLVATVIWWNITQRTMMTKFLPSVEVNLQNNLKPSLRLAQDQKTPKVSVRIIGPKSDIEALNSDSFQMNPDMSFITEATETQVSLKPEDLVPRPHLLRVLQVGKIRAVDAEAINPRRISVRTEWNSKVLNVVPWFEGRPALGYIITATSVTPATLTVAGDLQGLETRTRIRNREQLVFVNERSSFDHPWMLDEMDLGDLEVLDWDREDSIRFHVDIEPEFTGQEFKNVFIQVADATDAHPLREVTVEPSVVDVYLQGTTTLIQSVTSESIALGLDVSEFPVGAHEVDVHRLTPRNLPGSAGEVSIRDVTPSVVRIEISPPSGPYRPVEPTMPEIPPEETVPEATHETPPEDTPSAATEEAAG